ncbi:MAG: cyclic nucleotide-binding domain-containing protein [Verrucomicrobia bacterium]|nr:cyclic nucleotide-binding domain-containing protein [Verrucomicrobiota bacterium]
MHVQPIFPGVFYLSVGEHSLLAGCPPEIVKVLMQRGLKSPSFILLPDRPVSHGESQVAVEFPLYHHLFVGGKLATGERLGLIGSRRRIQAARELLDLTLFGPDAKQMAEWEMPAQQAEELARETRSFHLKDAHGKVLPLDALITTCVIEDVPVDLGWCIIRRVEPNRFEIAADGHTKLLDLTVEHEQSPPYPVNTDLTPTTLVKLGVEVLGGSTGFSATQASSGFALCHDGNHMLVDAIPYLNAHLRARGIARNQIRSLFLSHIHDDHCNLISLLQYNRRIQVLTTPLIYRMMVRKLALLMDHPEESLQDYFVFIPLEPGQEANFFGLRITPFYSSHSIPTIGAHFETTHTGKDCRLIFTSDMQALSDLKRLQRTGVITQERYLQIAELYRQPAQLLLADGGEGQIHGDPGDAINSPAERIVFLHLDNLSERFQAHFCTATSGKRFNLLRGETDYNLTRTIEFLLEYFPGMPPVWISCLLANQSVMTFNAGDILIREGTRSEGCVYMILTGYAQVVQHDGEHKHILAQMEAGELIGEMSVILGQGQRNASVVALSPVTVTAFAESSFREFIRHQGYETKLKALWQIRELLQNFPYLRALQQPVLRELATLVTLENLPAATGPRELTSICAAGSLMLPLGEGLELRREGRMETIEPNAAPILCTPDVTLLTEAEFQHLLLRAEDAAKLRTRIPAFRYFWEETLGLPLPGHRSGCLDGAIH